MVAGLVNVSKISKRWRRVRYKLIRTTKDFEYMGKSLPNFPFVLNDDGIPFDAVNDYFLYLAIDRNRNLATTIKGISNNILYVLNFFQNEKKPIKWNEVTSDDLKLLMNKLKKEGAGKKEILTNSTINGYLSAFCQFLWWAEKTAGLCQGVIGIADISKSKLRFRVPLTASRGKDKEYKIPWLLKSVEDKSRIRGSKRDWDAALDKTINHDLDGSDFKAVAKKHRDEIILRLIRENSLRRTEVVHLTVSQFHENPCEGERRIWIVLNKTKYYESREVGIFVDLYWDIKDYIESSRKELVRGKKVSDALIPSIRTGQFFQLNSMNTLLNEYGVKPHDGRAIGLTERFIDLIEKGINQNEAVLIVSEEAGHSLKTGGATLIKHYLRAKEIVTMADVMPRSELEARNLRLEREIEQLKSKLEDAGVF